MAQANANANRKKASDDVNAQIEALKDDIAKLTNAVADLGREKKEELENYAKGKAGEAKAKAQDGADYLRENAEMAYGKANDFVVERPAAALGIAAAVGFIVGQMSARR